MIAVVVILWGGALAYFSLRATSAKVKSMGTDEEYIKAKHYRTYALYQKITIGIVSLPLILFALSRIF